MAGLILIGAHHSAIDDIDKVPKVIEYDYMAIGLDSVTNYAGVIRYFATYHPKDLREAYVRRRVFDGNTDWKVISHHKIDGVDIIIPFEAPSGSSALLGVTAGIKLLYDKIILCGVPLTGFNAKGVDYSQFRKGWEAKREVVKDKCRSMSGWTKEFLGEPTKEWLDD